jgi:hypothetical protein
VQLVTSKEVRLVSFYYFLYVTAHWPNIEPVSFDVWAFERSEQFVLKITGKFVAVAGGYGFIHYPVGI